MSLDPCASLAHFTTTIASASSAKLIVFDLAVDGVDKNLRALLDTGASNNFVRSKSLEGSSLDLPSPDSVYSELLVRLADGSQLSVPKSSIKLRYSLGIRANAMFPDDATKNWDFRGCEDAFL